jgi:hypothetical protein
MDDRRRPPVARLPKAFSHVNPGGEPVVRSGSGRAGQAKLGRHSPGNQVWLNWLARFKWWLGHVQEKHASDLALPRRTDTWSHRPEREKVIKWVKSGRMYVKWGNLEEYGHVWFIPSTCPTKFWLTNFLAEKSAAPATPIHGRKSELHVSRESWVSQYFGSQWRPTKPLPMVTSVPTFW